MSTSAKRQRLARPKPQPDSLVQSLEEEQSHGVANEVSALVGTAPPDHPTARVRRQHNARVAQRMLGNRVAGRLLQRDGELSLPPLPGYQLTPPTLLGEPRRPSLLGDQPRLHLDPAIEAELRAMQVRTMLDPAVVRPQLAQLPIGPIQLPPPGPQAGPLATPAPPTPAAPAPQPRTGEAQAPPRAGSAGDVVGAIMAIPEVDQAITRLQTEAGTQVRLGWGQLRLGEQIGLISVVALIGGGAIAGVASDPDAQRFVFSQLSGKVIPVPGLSFLRAEFNAQDSNLMLGLHLDVGALLPSFLGFGPGSSSAIGGPPAPATPPWASPAQRSVVRRMPMRDADETSPAEDIQGFGNSTNQAQLQRQAIIQRTPETDWERHNQAGRVDWLSDRHLILWNFRVGRSDLKADHLTTLEQFFRANGVLYRNPATILDVSGHTSGSGTGAINAPVSDARARAVATWAQGQGHVTAAQVSSSAAGASRPLVAEGSPIDMAHNRRVEIEVQVPPGAPVGGADMHAGAAIPDAATQAEILGELGRPVAAAPAPAPGPAGPAPAPPAPVPWDGAMVGGVLSPAARAARDALKREVTAALQTHLAGVMPGIRATATQPRLPAASFEGPGQGAKSVVDARFGSFAAAAALTADQATARHGFAFRASGPGQTLFDAFDPADRAATGAPISAESVSTWMADRDAARAAQDAHHFDPNDRSRGPDERDFLFNEIITPFATANRADLEQYDQFGFALTPAADRIVVPTALRTDLSNVTPPGGMSPAERATRWDGWMILVHEYIHTLEHPAYSSAASGNGVMREGFCEMFTKEVLDNTLPSARTNIPLITSVEGPGLPPPTEDILPGTYPPNQGYMDDFLHAVSIRNRIGDNAAKEAFFQGHVEYLGLAPDSSTIAPSAGPQIGVPAGVASLADLATATGVPEADIIAANPGVDLRAALPPRVAVPGCSEHVVVEAVDSGGAHQLETQAQIATQHGIIAGDLTRANPGVDWAHLSVGQRLLIPRH